MDENWGHLHDNWRYHPHKLKNHWGYPYELKNVHIASGCCQCPSTKMTLLLSVTVSNIMTGNKHAFEVSKTFSCKGGCLLPSLVVSCCWLLLGVVIVGLSAGATTVGNIYCTWNISFSFLGKQFYDLQWFMARLLMMRLWYIHAWFDHAEYPSRCRWHFPMKIMIMILDVQNRWMAKAVQGELVYDPTYL